MIRYAWFPDSRQTPEWGECVLGIFRLHERAITPAGRDKPLTSQEVLQVLAEDLRQAGFVIERRRLAAHSPGFPASGAVFARDQFDVFHPEWLCCLAIESLTPGPESKPAARVEPLLVVDIDTLCLALPNAAPKKMQEKVGVHDYDSACALAQSVYAHARVKLPYRMLLVGY